MIVAIASTKGGAGKTTMAVNLAIARAAEKRNVLLIDGDEQESAASFTALRGESPGYSLVRCHDVKLKGQIERQASKYDDIIVDVGGTDGGALRAALLVTDMVAIPVIPTVFDCWATSQMVDLVNEARQYNKDLRAVAFLNCCSPYGDSSANATKFIESLDGVQVLNVRVGKRVSFSKYAEKGKSVLEARSSKLTVFAQVEIRRLSAEIFGET
jgi:chromosome partitioning protein